MLYCYFPNRTNYGLGREGCDLTRVQFLAINYCETGLPLVGVCLL